MNAKLTSVALALIATSAAAFGADISTTGKTRAEVRAEVEQAYAQGQLGHQPEFVEHVRITSTTPRAVIRAELDKAQAQQQPARGVSEFVEHTNIASGKTRAEVRAEIEQAYAQGQLNHEPEFVEHVHVASTKSRDEVREEAIRSANRAIAAQSGS